MLRETQYQTFSPLQFMCFGTLLSWIWIWNVAYRLAIQIVKLVKRINTLIASAFRKEKSKLDIIRSFYSWNLMRTERMDARKGKIGSSVARYNTNSPILTKSWCSCANGAHTVSCEAAVWRFLQSKRTFVPLSPRQASAAPMGLCQIFCWLESEEEDRGERMGLGSSTC